MVFAFIIGGLLERREASLSASFFEFHPWIFMILAPAVGMRLWSEEHRLERPNSSHASHQPLAGNRRQIPGSVRCLVHLPCFHLDDRLDGG